MNLNIEDLRKLTTHLEVADVFGFDSKAMLKDLYRRGSGHRIFSIPKLNGGFRTIQSPHATHRHIQRVLKPILDKLYRPNESVHGFVAGRSIASNAICHVGRRTLIKIDLSSFFGSISFQRVRGLFLSEPFKLSWVPANILAHACCCSATLSTGGITSPTISNILCSRMDREIGRLVRSLNGRYTRYADDLTFSFNRSIGVLPEITVRSSQGEQELSPVLNSIVEKHGFTTNKTKFKAVVFGRKRVTGIVVNEKVNISREWIRKLDSKLYAAEKHGIAAAAKFTFGESSAPSIELAFQRHLQGLISYLKMIRGRTDWIGSDFAHRYNILFDHTLLNLRIPDVELITQRERIDRAIWVITSHASTQSAHILSEGSGTGFTSEKGLIFTALHVVTDGVGKIHPHVFARRARSPTTLVPCDVVAHDAHLDIAILRLRGVSHSETRIRLKCGDVPSPSTAVTAIGFPSYFPGHVQTISKHHITSIKTLSAVETIEVDGILQGGMSGGPLLDEAQNVIGIIRTGIVGTGADRELARNYITCITHALTMAKNIS